MCQYQCVTSCMRVCRCRLNAWEMIIPYYTFALYSKDLVICRSITVVIVIVKVPLWFQKIVSATCPYISSSTCCMFWPPAWWALRLHWWPLQNAAMLHCIYYLYSQMCIFLYHCCILLEIKHTATILVVYSITLDIRTVVIFDEVSLAVLSVNSENDFRIFIIHKRFWTSDI